MLHSKLNLHDYYLERLPEFIQDIQRLLIKIKSHQKTHHECQKILSSLTQLPDFPYLSQLANTLLQDYTPSNLTSLESLITALSEHPTLGKKQSSQIILSHLLQAKNLWKNPISSESPVEQIKFVAHTLVGSGGSFGFHDISENAFLVEHSESEELLVHIDALLHTLSSHVPTPIVAQQAVILVIQKDQSLSFILEHALTEQKYQVVTTTMATEAWKALESRPFDLIITDLVLPDIDGRVLVNELRARTETQNTPIVLLASPTAMQTLTPQLLPVDQIIEKPFQIEQIMQEVQSLLQKASSRPVHEPAVDNTLLPDLPELQAHLLELKQGQHYLLRLNFLKKTQEAPSIRMFSAFIKDLKYYLHVTYTPAWLKNGQIVVLIPQTSQQEVLEYLRALVLHYQESPIFAPFQFQVAFQAVNTDSLEQQIAQIDQLFFLPESEPAIFMKQPLSEKKPSILLADDDPLIASIICFRLAQAGYEVQHLTSGDKVLPSLQESLVKLVILDIKMPGLDGFSVLKQLRQYYTSAELPIMMLTSLGNEQHIVEGFRLGTNEYLTKPFSPDELLSRIQRLIQ